MKHPPTPPGDWWLTAPDGDSYPTRPDIGERLLRLLLIERDHPALAARVLGGGILSLDEATDMARVQPRPTAAAGDCPFMPG
jgi:hypothetical protein